MASDSHLKKANALEEYTHEQVSQLLKSSQDPIFFIENFCRIITGEGLLLPFKLYDYQKELILSYTENRYVVTRSGRQTGKSQTSAAFLLWWALFHENQTILIVSNVFNAAIEIMDRIKQMYIELPSFIKPGVSEKWNQSAIGFDNNSRIIASATTANSSRGKSPNVTYLDELAFVANNIAEQFFTSLMPAITATKGKCLVTSTTNGTDNLFYKIYAGAEAGTNGFVPIFVPWDAPPDRDEEFKKAEIGRIGELRFRQEFASEFISSDPLLFSSIFIESYPVLPLEQYNQDHNGILWFSSILSNHTYLLAMDCATGSGQDFTVIVIYDFDTLEQVGEFRNNTTSSATIYNILKYLIKYIKSNKAESYWSFENNAVGEAMIALYDIDDNPPDDGILISENGKKRIGFYTSKSKNRYCMDLKNLFESGKLKVKSKNTINEMRNYIRRNGSYAARNGSTDDTISAHLILVRMLEELVNYDDRAYDLLYENIENYGEFDNSINNDIPMISTNYSMPTKIERNYINPWKHEETFDEEYINDYKDWLDNPELYNIRIG